MFWASVYIEQAFIPLIHNITICHDIKDLSIQRATFSDRLILMCCSKQNQGQVISVHSNKILPSHQYKYFNIAFLLLSIPGVPKLSEQMTKNESSVTFLIQI